MDTLAWASWIVGGVLALLGLLVAAWSIRGDRSRGRRRCPRCWYDMSKVPGMTCPECGRTPKNERRFGKTRRRWKGLIWTGLLVLLGMVAAVTPAAYTGKWVQYTPTPLLKVVVDQFKDDAKAEFEKVVQSNTGGLGVAKQSSWEKLLLASESARHLAAFTAMPIKQRNDAREASTKYLWHARTASGLAYRTNGQIPPDESSPSLMVYENVQLAVTILSNLGDESCVASDALLGLFADGQYETANFGFRAIAGTKTTATALAPGLMKLIRESTSGPMRINATVALALVSSPSDQRVCAFLLGAIEHDDSPDVRMASIFAMARVDPTSEQLFQALTRSVTTDKTAIVRHNALEMLGNLYVTKNDWASAASAARIRNPMYESYNMSDPLWATSYLMGASPISGTHDTRLIPLCIKALSDTDSRIRQTSATYLDFFGADARSAIPAIDAALATETDSAVKQALLQAFLHVEAGPRSVKRLTEALDDPKLAEYTLRWAFAELGRLGPAAASAVPTIERFIASHEFSLVFAVKALANIGEAGLPQLLKLLDDKRDGVRIMVSEDITLSNISTCGVSDQLIPRMKDTCRPVRVYIAKTLAKCPEQWSQVFPVMVEAMRNEESFSARMEYVELLAKFGAGHLDEMVPQLAVSLTDEAWSVRLVAAQQLVALGKDAELARAALVKATKDADESVRAAARTVLEMLDAR